MASLNDAKYAALVALTGLTGSLDDLEQVWLLNETGASSGHVQDLWYLFMEQMGYTTGSLGDRLYDFLHDLGYSGTLNDMLYLMWTDGGPGENYNVINGSDNVVNGADNVVVRLLI
jgi:hypothetical protein